MLRTIPIVLVAAGATVAHASPGEGVAACLKAEGTRLVRRVYLEWPGIHGHGSSTPALRRRAVRLVVRHTAHPHRAGSVGVVFSNGTRRQARTLEKACLHSRP
jgi:hypothetical protein